MFFIDSLKVESLNNFRVLNLGIGNQGNQWAYITENFYMYDVCFNIVIVSSANSDNYYTDTVGNFICISNYNYNYNTVEKPFNLNGIEFYFVANNPETPKEGKGRIAIKIPSQYQRITLLTHLSISNLYAYYKTPMLFEPEYVDSLPAHKYLLIQ